MGLRRGCGVFFFFFPSSDAGRSRLCRFWAVVVIVVVFFCCSFFFFSFLTLFLGVFFCRPPPPRRAPRSWTHSGVRAAAPGLSGGGANFGGETRTNPKAAIRHSERGRPEEPRSGGAAGSPGRER